MKKYQRNLNTHSSDDESYRYELKAVLYSTLRFSVETFIRFSRISEAQYQRERKATLLNYSKEILPITDTLVFKNNRKGISKESESFSIVSINFLK